ncbi:hypothetical protein EST38_g4876 [Candolleomyces aberdarensis]|uniref:HNH nuclease domain-containing protein n=1 Tax=Candolleomyces aberdarensis TaxID=2316362 RepID=A0A4V1Q462_9AGAR|nr:hypothetical protein EST38_g4876 [Candolleomyces aberdarensis]
MQGRNDAKALPSMVSLSSGGLDVWPLLLNAEKYTLKKGRDGSPVANAGLVGVRVLGYLLIELWEKRNRLPGNPYLDVLKRIQACKSIRDLCALGVDFRGNLLQLYSEQSCPHFLSRAWQRDPPPFEQVVANAFDEEEAEDRGTMSTQILARDGFRCVLTGLADVTSILAGFVDLPPSGRVIPSTSTQCTHILSVINEIGDDCVLPDLSWLGIEKEINEITGGEAGGCCNTITMSIQLHLQFNEFELWLEEVPGQANTYQVSSCYELVLRQDVFHGRPPPAFEMTIDPRFKQECDAQGIPYSLPDPRLIALHGVIARVGRKSGAAEQQDAINRVLEGGGSISSRDYSNYTA